ncbi:MAG: 2-oxoglutarate dehydrogenase complex dihydrolipoyllysine-residue succinyltransferase [Chlorobi bacterium]|nr:2-oxoglutarate dehydrogenase complex dihydrolipoyllysine-residue succinyltransferase [Chlorobiota bacterium]
MLIEIKVPSPGESITEVQIASWLVETGDFVEMDQDIVEVDSDKATLSIPATQSGKIELKVEEGETIEVGSIIAVIDTSAKGKPKKKAETEDIKTKTAYVEAKTVDKPKAEQLSEKTNTSVASNYDTIVSPLAKKLMQEDGISENDLLEFFKSYRISKKDVRFYKENKGNDQIKANNIGSSPWTGSRKSSKVKMTMLRKKLSQRLVSVKNETAMLTTFNEVNMSPIMAIRKKYKEVFKEKHGVGLGFMSFFTKAITEAIAHFPAINSQISGDEILGFDYVDVGIAVSAPKGLMVPVVRNAEMLSLAEIESEIKRLALKARDGKLSLDDMTGGTFTITNGGVFGSMLSTPILNPPQSAILGMHNIVERPVAINGKVEIHPIMYVALSYDHRIIDGSTSVGFLVEVKEMLENPEKMLFGGNSPVESLLGI